MKDILYSRFEMKSLGDQKDGYARFSGYASVFDYLDSQMDIVQQGAFANSIMKRSNVKMLWQHNTNELIGNYPILKEDTKGLYVEGEICLAAQRGQECYGLMKQGSLDSLSIGFMTKDAEILPTGVRVIKELDLYEISPVTFPANEMAMIDNVKSLILSPKSLEEMTITEFERKLRDVFKCSQAKAKALASKGFNSLNHRDGDIGELTTWDSILSSSSKLLIS